MHFIRTLGWLVCGVYATIPLFWLIIHPFADRWRKRFRAPLKVVTPIWIFLWILTWLATYPWRLIAVVPERYREAILWGGSGLNWISLAAVPF